MKLLIVENNHKKNILVVGKNEAPNDVLTEFAYDHRNEQVKRKSLIDLSCIKGADKLWSALKKRNTETGPDDTTLIDMLGMVFEKAHLMGRNETSAAH